MAVVTALAVDLLLTRSLQCRSVWACNRSQAFTAVISAWDDLEWKRNFRVSRTTFRHLCNELRTKLQLDSTLRETVTVEKRVAIALWRLGTNIEFRTISHFFGVGLSSRQVHQNTCRKWCYRDSDGHWRKVGLPTMLWCSGWLSHPNNTLLWLPHWLL